MTKTVSHAQWFLAPYCIGMKLRSLRMEKRLTLSRLAEETGLSTALLSKIETDRMTPTLSTLATVCRVYGVGLGYFFSEPTGQTLSVTRKVAHQGRGRSSQTSTHILLNPGVADRRMDACLVDFAPGAAAVRPDGKPHEAAMLVYVLQGSLHLELSGMQETLDAGDCAYLESDLPMAWGAEGSQNCKILAVTPIHREWKDGATPAH